MEIEIKDVTMENVNDLVGLCVPSWEDPHHARTLKEGGLKKEEWVKKALQRFDCCAKVAYIKGKPVGFIEFYPMHIFPILPRRDKRTVLITCIFIPNKTLQNQGIGTMLIRSLIEDLKSRPLSCFKGEKAEEVAIGSWGSHTSFAHTLPKFKNFFLRNRFKEDPTFPDPTGKGGILVFQL